ncbi:SMI1/KNR4 family protein [Actinoallomurus spadix]|uniref:SMI1/KNR4 family protein n=1 Tax=Actinoallomurus spadix TaxID=79912 RepID=A0ABP3G4F0_9ACTN|nr:SMI1/KNR4 family protein [Actinoallomurus spadix]MCO5987373.1 SMI1/KNR4 family protein [Actinoallomurus spadix]
MTETLENLALPTALAEVAEVGFEWEYDEETDESRGCDFEPYQRFEAPEKTAWWFRLWTGNPEVDGGEFRFFGSTGSGDYAGFWLVRPGAPITEQPVIYIDSEGECGVIARDLGDLLWLFADGFGPMEAFTDPDQETEPNEAFRVIAERHAPGRHRPAAEIVAAARAEFPDFAERIAAMCR